MAKSIEQKIFPCRACARDTIHHRNSKQMSWLMHLVLAIFTAGLWLIVWVPTLLWHVLTKPIAGAWTCAKCGIRRA